MTCARCGMQIALNAPGGWTERQRTTALRYWTRREGWRKTRDGWTCPECVKPRRKKR